MSRYVKRCGIHSAKFSITLAFGVTAIETYKGRWEMTEKPDLKSTAKQRERWRQTKSQIPFLNGICFASNFKIKTALN